MSEQWTVVNDPSYKVPYAYSGRNWIGYDTAESVSTKVQPQNFHFGSNSLPVHNAPIKLSCSYMQFSRHVMPVNMVLEVLWSGVLKLMIF